MTNDKPDTITAQFSDALETGKTVFSLSESRNILELAGVPFNKSGLATSEAEAAKMANEMGYPIVMKIVSPQIIHKTEVGGVKVNIASEDEVKSAFTEIVTNAKAKVPDAEIKGVMLEEMVKGTELIIGTTMDPQFGHMIMFGIGGIFVEVYKDVSFRLVPITAGDAKDMLSELKGGALLEGVRGLPKADTEQLVDILMKISNLVDKHNEISEMDLNPLIISEKGIIAVDARIILQKKEDIRDKIRSIKEHLEKL